MTRLFPRTLFCVAFALVGATAVAEDCLKQGDAIGAFFVTKVGGAADDGVSPGDELCYRCRYGSSPIVLVFARRADSKLVELVQQIDSTIAANEEARLRGLVTFLGEDLAEVKDGASEFAQQTGVKFVPVAIAKETETGPPNYKLDDSEVTVLIANDSQLVSMHRSKKKRINIPNLMREVKQMIQTRRAKRQSSRF